LIILNADTSVSPGLGDRVGRAVEGDTDIILVSPVPLQAHAVIALPDLVATTATLAYQHT